MAFVAEQLGLLTFALALTCAACTGQRIAGAADAAATHLPTFSRFDGWARRVMRSDVVLRGPQALRETTFAPLRGDRSVLWARVVDASGRALSYRSPVELETLSFVTIDAAELGRLRVAVSRSCRIRTHKPVVRACVVIDRPAAQDSVDRSSVSVAFRQPASG